MYRTFTIMSILPFFLSMVLLTSCITMSQEAREMYKAFPFEYDKDFSYKKGKKENMPDDIMEGINDPEQQKRSGVGMHIGARRSGVAFVYPRYMKPYKYHMMIVEAEVNWLGAESAELRLRTFPSTIVDGKYRIFEIGDPQEYPFTSYRPTKHSSKRVWTFKGEHKITHHYSAVPKDKDLYLTYKLTFYPHGRDKRKQKYGFKLRSKQ